MLLTHLCTHMVTFVVLINPVKSCQPLIIERSVLFSSSLQILKLFVSVRNTSFLFLKLVNILVNVINKSDWRWKFIIGSWKQWPWKKKKIICFFGNFKQHLIGWNRKPQSGFLSPAFKLNQQIQFEWIKSWICFNKFYLSSKVNGWCSCICACYSHMGYVYIDVLHMHTLKNTAVTSHHQVK